VKKFFEKIVEGGLLISGSVTSLAILLIIVFLFKEASGLFNSPAVEEGYVLAVNSSNPVKHLSPEKTKQVFDSEITNWSELGGNEEEILVFRFSDLTNFYTEEELGPSLNLCPTRSTSSFKRKKELLHSSPKCILPKISREL